MTLSLKHAKTSAKSDGVDTSFIQPSDWNAEHTITAAQYTLLGRGTGAGAVSDLAQDDVGVPLGTSLVFTGPSGSVPAKYLLEFGQAISRATYADYFALVGTTYGVGDGSTTFNIRDMRGRLDYGLGNMGGTESSRINSFIASTLGAVGGAQTTAGSISTSGSLSVGGSCSVSVGGTATLHGQIDNNSATAQAGASQGVAQINDPVTVSGTISANGSGSISGGTSGTLGGTCSVGTVSPGMAANKMVKVLR